MQKLEKILEEIDETIERYKENANVEAVDICYGMKVAKKIIRKHMNDEKCGECSRRKWYQKGFEDGKKYDGWIPVEDRLPENEGFYLVTFSESGAVRLLGYGSCRRNIKWDPIGFGWYDIGTATYFAENSVTAWRPLPEPYQAERSDNHDGE